MPQSARRRARAKTPTRTPKGNGDILRVLKPIIPAIVTPVVEPVVMRLDRHEELLRELKKGFDIQFKRIAEIQAQLDALLGGGKSSQ